MRLCSLLYQYLIPGRLDGLGMSFLGVKLGRCFSCLLIYGVSLSFDLLKWLCCFREACNGKLFFLIYRAMAERMHAVMKLKKMYIIQQDAPHNVIADSPR
jgi:hypothetical protein